MTTTPLLEGRGVTKRFGGLAAVNDVDFAIYPGEMLGLIGPNGSGKTTLFDCLTRVQDIDAGTLVFKGEDITRCKPHQVARMGLSRTFQIIRVYSDLTVRENLLLSRRWGGLRPRDLLRSTTPEIADRADELMDFLLLDRLREDRAATLSGGQKRLLEIGMALMPRPDLVLLDEATSGVNPTLVETIKDRVRVLNESGVAFLMVEHNIRFIADLCERVVVLDYGRKLAEGTPDEISDNEDVIEAYFGYSGDEGADVG